VSRHRLTDAETFELMALVSIAFEAKGEARRDACKRLCEWYEAVPFMRACAALWRRQRRQDALLRLICETSSDHPTREEVAGMTEPPEELLAREWGEIVPMEEERR
jgi:hypothetical protein